MNRQPAALPFCLPVLVLALAGSDAAAEVLLVADGRQQAAVVLPEEPEELERLAADELVNHLQMMTGAALPMVSPGEVPAALTPIYLGRAADAALDEATRQRGKNRSGFTLAVTEDRIDIRGLSDEGTLFGVYELLEQLGCRWYNIGDLGRVFPEVDRAALARGTTSQAPSIIYRHLQHIDADSPWSRRARLGGDRRATGRHGIPGLPRRDFSINPQWYSLIDGERRDRQDCLSNPEVLERATEGVRREAEAQGGSVQYVSAASHDGGGYCQCDGCRALDQGVFDPLANTESMTDRYVWFFNRILENLEQDFPNLHIVHYTYAAHMMPPAIEMNPRIVPVFAPITLERVRGMDNPMGTDRHILRWLIDEYSERGVNEMYYRGYFGNLACPQFPFSQLDRIRNDLPAMADKGVSVMRIETIFPTWGSNFLNQYVAAKVMWDAATDVDALLDEFYRLYYGPAEQPMRAYHEQLEAAFRDTPYMTGSSYLYFPIFIGQQRTVQLRNHLDRAAAAVSGDGAGVFAERVAAVRFNWDRMELFLDMIAARNRHDFEQAHEIMQRYLEQTAVGAEQRQSYAHEGYRYGRDGALLPWREHPERRGNYFGRFFQSAIVSGFERTVGNGELVAAMDDQWLFLLDPSEIGELAGYQRPGQLGGNWQPLRTSSRSWSDQGLHYYKGVAWYRQQVEIPEHFEGREIYLWFGGVDRLASVWINGRFVGTSREPAEGLPGVPGSFRPFDLPATEVVRVGRPNWVVVRIENKSLSELGTGGIVAPVMFWSPHGDWVPGQ